MSRKFCRKSVGILAVVASMTSWSHASEAPVAADAYVNNAYPSVNYGGLSNLYVNASGTDLHYPPLGIGRPASLLLLFSLSCSNGGLHDQLPRKTVHQSNPRPHL